jgi:hypothetical protein
MREKVARASGLDHCPADTNMGRILAIAVAVLVSSIAALGAEWPPKVAELELTLHQAAASCIEGEECVIYLRVANEGTAPFEAPIDIKATSTTPVIPGATPQDIACRRDGYLGFACRSKPLSLDAGRFTLARLSFRMLPTPLETNEVCVSLSSGATIRNAAMSSAAGLLGLAPSSSGVGAEDLFGSWGKGDMIAANDKACLKVVIARPPDSPSCQAGFAMINGACADPSSLCTAGRTFDETSKTCACPSGQVYETGKQACGAPLTCDGGRTAAGHFCACPQDRPRWNKEAGACEVLALKGETPGAAAEPEIETPAAQPSSANPTATKDPPATAAQPPDLPPATLAGTPEAEEPVARKKATRRSAMEKPVRKRVYRQRRVVLSCPPGQIRVNGICRTTKPRTVGAERRNVARAAPFLPCPPGYKLGPLGRRCWNIDTLEANRRGANVRNKWVCAAGLRRQGIICVSD